jgi:hypothetical protein
MAMAKITARKVLYVSPMIMFPELIMAYLKTVYMTVIEIICKP